MSCCIFCYFFFILMTHIYIGYLFLAFFMLVFAKKVHRNIGYKYRCGRCGEKLKQKVYAPIVELSMSNFIICFILE